MRDVRVVEVALYALVPAAGAVLADWGAEVIKVEHPAGGDPIRNLSAFGVDPDTGGFTYLWEVMNRGKRSVCIDLATEDGHALLLELVRSADVFLTNFLPPARRKLGIDAEELMAVNPRLIYARGSGYGTRGDEADKGGYDGITYWNRTGVAAAATPPGQQLVGLPGPAFGDIQGAMTLAGGISAALYERERTGRGCVVDTSLFAAGMWAMQATFVGSSVLGVSTLPRTDRFHVANPLANTYRTADDRYIVLAMLQADRYWERLCEVIGRPELAADPRFTTMETRRANAVECVAILDAVFAARPLAEWCRVLATQDGQWEVVRLVGELADDAQAWANGYLQRVHYDDGRELVLIPAPVQFNEEPSTLRPAPELGADTEDVLLGLGHDWDSIIALKVSGAVG